MQNGKIVAHTDMDFLIKEVKDLCRTFTVKMMLKTISCESVASRVV